MFFKMIILSISLFFDGRVSLFKKLIPIIVGLYIMSPIDILPDAIPVLGLVDDFSLFVFGLDMFIRTAGEQATGYHMRRLGIDLTDSDTPINK